ncbi:MAG: NapC/NirT family cytochrome c [Nitrospirae bacterium]|nr:NapC/NirT family cytochrome c [Nitrospirota bacterium]
MARKTHMFFGKRLREIRVSRHGLVLKKPLGTLGKFLLVFGFVAILFAPLLPITVRGSAFFNDSAEFCINCHQMNQIYQNWSHSSHRNWAVCADCHVSQKSLVTKLAGKVRDGLNHGYPYLLDSAPDPIRIKKHGALTAMENCLRCHGELVSNFPSHDRKCWECHRGEPHGY